MSAGNQPIATAPNGPPGWWQALSPPIYLISVVPGAAALTATGPTREHLALLLPATVAVVLLQHAINLFNDAADWRLGADQEKWNSWVRYHRYRTAVATLHGAISLVGGGLLGLATLLGADRLWLVAVAAPMILLGYLYNAGERPLAYTHFGEWVTGLCYGPGVYGCLWLLTGAPIDLGALCGMLAFAALAMALLLSHQPPQIDSDRAAGKLSFAVRYGAAVTTATARRLWRLFLLSWGLALWQAGSAPPVVAAYSAAALLAAYLPAAVRPARLLMPATLLVGLGLLLRMVE